MANFIIGDVHGCFNSFLELLQQIDFNKSQDTLFLTGDIVNRGPYSLNMLRWVYQHQDSVKMVLGNHDLHLIGIVEGCRKLRKKDSLAEILQANECNKWVEWLCQQPLLIHDDQLLLVHAGLLPEWPIIDALELAETISEQLSEKRKRSSFLHRWYFDRDATSPLNEDEEKILHALDVFTRMRTVHVDGNLNFDYTGSPDECPETSLPWYKFQQGTGQLFQFNGNIVFGHWSTHGFRTIKCGKSQVICMDSGCLWGGTLTAFCPGSRQHWSQPNIDGARTP